MAEMSVARLDWRKRCMMLGLQQKPHNRYPYHLHRRAYCRGDLRCTCCKKWLNPNIADEAIEIEIAGGGRRFHDKRYCLVNSEYPSTLAMMPKYHGTRKRRVDNAKRY